MKKAVSVLGAFCFGAFITIGVMACADDYSQYNPSAPTASGATVVDVKHVYQDDWYYDYEFIYDEYGRIVQVKYEDYYDVDGPKYWNQSFNVTYDSNVVTIFASSTNNFTIKFAQDVKSYSIGVVNDYIINIVISAGDL